MSTPATAADLLDREFLTLRSKLIDLAAALDRLDRAEGSVAEDARLTKIRLGLEVLLSEEGNRAEQLQMLFSLSDDPQWRAAVR